MKSFADLKRGRKGDEVKRVPQSEGQYIPQALTFPSRKGPG